MDIWQQLTLALIQGLTEFLPVSSSAHLILVPVLAGWQDQGLVFDVAVHVGTLGAVVLYFRQQLTTMTQDWIRSLAQRQHVGESRLAWGVLIGTIPVGVFGLAFKDYIADNLREPVVIALATILFGLLLWWADRYGKQQRSEQSLTLKDFLLIGVAQACALVPGTSRSGITITVGLMLGMTRQAAARFSFLLSIPVIVLAGGLAVIDLIQDEIFIDWQALITGALVSGIIAYLSIHWFLRLLDSVGMMPFIIYRLILGVILLVVFL